MDHTFLVTLGKLTIVGAILAGAAFMDLRYRRIPDAYWAAMCIFAGPLLVWEMYIQGANPMTFLSLLLPVVGVMFVLRGYPELREVARGNPTDLLFAALYASAVAGGVLSYIFGDRVLAGRVLFSFLFMILYFLMYQMSIGGIRIIHGGADAKCMIVLAALFPWYGEIDWITMGPFYESIGRHALVEYIFPFHLSVMLNGAVVTVIFMAVYLPIKNMIRGDMNPLRMFSSYREDVDRLEGRHVWIIHQEGGDKAKKDPTPSVIHALKKRGERRVWVTPKIPFILSLTLGFGIQVVVGNLGLLLMLLLL